jgi:hypothetical protein
MGTPANNSFCDAAGAGNKFNRAETAQYAPTTSAPSAPRRRLAFRLHWKQKLVRFRNAAVARELDVPPTITVRPCWPVRVIVFKDLMKLAKLYDRIPVKMQHTLLPHECARADSVTTAQFRSHAALLRIGKQVRI